MAGNAAEPVGQPVNPRDYAVVVGIDHYPDFRCLRGATADARDFASWLLDPLGGGLPPGNCKIILSADYPGCPPQTAHGDEEVEPRRPVQDDIDRAFRAIFRQLDAGAVTGRRLYVYFSGHGLGRDALGADLCLAMWSTEFWRDAALDSQRYEKKLIASGYFDEVVFFLDCCRVREVNTHGQDALFNWPKPGARAGQVRRFVGFATEFQDVAREAALASAPAEGEQPVVRGYFTRALLDALRGGAARPEGGVTASVLKTYLERETPLLAQRAGHPIQRPEVVNGLGSDQGKEPVFGRYLPGARYRIRFTPGRPGPVVFVGPDLRVLFRWQPAQGPVECPLSQGLYALRDETSGDEKSLRVTEGAGVYDVDF